MDHRMTEQQAARYLYLVDRRLALLMTGKDWKRSRRSWQS